MKIICKCWLLPIKYYVYVFSDKKAIITPIVPLPHDGSDSGVGSGATLNVQATSGQTLAGISCQTMTFKLY